MVITVFRNRLKPGLHEEYGQLLNRMRDLARTMPGFISAKTFIAEDGERVTIVEFESEATQRAWSQHAQHVEAKKRGRQEFYLDYKLQVCTLVRESRFPK